MTALLTDEALTAQLRERGLVGPIDGDFLAEYRQHRTFVELMEKVEATPGAPDRMRRVLIQLGVLSPADHGDENLLAAWASFKAGVTEYEDNGPDALPEVDAPALIRWETADDAVGAAPATTSAGALVKLRRALFSMAGSRWVETALIKGDDSTLLARAGELSYPTRLVVDAIAAIELVQRGAA